MFPRACMGIPADQATVLSRQTLSMYDIRKIKKNVLTTQVHLNQCYKHIFIVIVNLMQRFLTLIFARVIMLFLCCSTLKQSEELYVYFPLCCYS